MMSRRKFKSWVNSLLDEGYDLSDYTWDELYEEYLTEIGVNFGGQAAVNKVRTRYDNDKKASQAWARDELNRHSVSGFSPPSAPATTPMDTAARNLLTKPRPNYNPPTVNPSGSKPNYAAAAKAYPSGTPENRTNNYYSNVAAGKYGSNVVMATNLKGGHQAVTVGKEYNAGKNKVAVYDAQGGRKIITKQSQEEFEAWVDELHEQGYNLSNYTWEGLFEYYCDEVLSERIIRSPIPQKPNPNSITQLDTSASTRLGQSAASSINSSKPSGIPVSRQQSFTGARAIGASSSQATSSTPALTPMQQWEKNFPRLAQANALRSQNASRESINKVLYNKGTGPNPNTTASSTSSVKTPLQSSRPVNSPINSSVTNNMQNKTPLNTATGSKKPGSVFKASFDFGKSNYISEDINYLYHSIYEGNRVDQDEDGDNDGADVMIARMIASGMSKEEAIRRTRNKSYNKKGKKSDEELKEFAALVPLVARAAAPLAGRLVGGAVARGVAGRVAAGAAEGGLQSALGRMAGNAAGNLAGRKVRKKLETMGQQDDSDEESTNESLAYEILNHLIENGYADTPEQAATMFENFSEEYQYAIIENLQNF